MDWEKTRKITLTPMHMYAKMFHKTLDNKLCYFFWKICLITGVFFITSWTNHWNNDIDGQLVTSLVYVNVFIILNYFNACTRIINIWMNWLPLCWVLLYHFRGRYMSKIGLFKLAINVLAKQVLKYSINHLAYHPKFSSFHLW